MRTVLFILGQLTDEDAEWLAGAGRRAEVPRGTALVRYGQPTPAVHIVLEGKFSVSRQGRELARVLPGETLGEMSFVDDALPSADVVATEDSAVLSVPRDVLRARLEGDPGFAARFYRALAMVLSQRLRDADGGLRSAPQAEGVLGPDELDPSVLDGLSQGGDRFKRILKAVSTR